jgi:hypothetical protein
MTVTLDQLAKIADQSPKPEARSNGARTPYDLSRVLADSGVAVSKRKEEPDGRVIYEVDCLTSTAHSDGAFFTQFPNGAVAYNCHHASCKGKGWTDVRDRLRLPTPARSDEEVSGSAPDAREIVVRELIQPATRSGTMPIMNPAAYVGLAGDVVRAIASTTEAHLVAILITFLVMFGNACGRDPSFFIGDARHGTNLFAALVGKTSRSRKGTSAAGPRRLMTRADSTWAMERVQGGLSTGEGLIWAVHDEITRVNKEGDREVVDPGVEDKRLLTIEEEMSQVLKTAQRHGSIISEIIRRAWDAPSLLQTMTKTSPSKATDAHISILGHITQAELLRQITETDLANGLANRFLWLLVDRSQLLPHPVGMSADTVNDLGKRIADCLEFARDVGVVRRDSEAEDLWAMAYTELERDRPGLSGAITARSSPIVLRLALIYALLDQSSVIRPQHLEAALAIWDYADASVTAIFGDLTGDDIADRAYATLRAEGRMSRNELMNAFGRNVSSARLGHALELLHQAGRVRAWRESPEGGKGRPRTVYEAVVDGQGGQPSESTE